MFLFLSLVENKRFVKNICEKQLREYAKFAKMGEMRHEL